LIQTPAIYQKYGLNLEKIATEMIPTVMSSIDSQVLHIKSPPKSKWWNILKIA